MDTVRRLKQIVFFYSATSAGFDKRSRRESENKVAKMHEDVPLFRGNTTLIHRDVEAISLGGFSNRQDFSCPRHSISFLEEEDANVASGNEILPSETGCMEQRIKGIWPAWKLRSSLLSSRKVNSTAKSFSPYSVLRLLYLAVPKNPSHPEHVTFVWEIEH